MKERAADVTRVVAVSAEPVTQVADAGASSELTRRGRFAHSAALVALVALLFYAAWIAVFFASGHEIRDFILISRRYVLQSHASSVIQLDPHYTKYGGLTRNFDGQFYYFIALDPPNARYYLDTGVVAAGYRYGRIVYPLLARALALGQPNVIPYTLLLVNWLAVAGGTWALAAWLKRRRVSPWLALIFALYPGVFSALQCDLVEALAYALVALAVYLFDFGGRRRVIASGAVFALAMLTRETTVVFAVIYGLTLLAPGAVSVSGAGSIRAWLSRLRDAWHGDWRTTWRPAATFFATAFVPVVVYKAWLLWWLGDPGMRADQYPLRLPFAGLFDYWPWNGNQYLQIECVILPALICAGVGLYALARQQWHAAVVALLANIVLFVFFLPGGSYDNLFGSGRVTTGVVLAALLAVPTLDGITRGRRGWLFACAALWLLALPGLLYGFVVMT